MMLRKRRLLKIVLLIVLISIVPYIIVSSIEPRNLYENGKFYINEAAVTGSQPSNVSAQPQMHHNARNLSGRRGENPAQHSRTREFKSGLPSTTKYCNSPLLPRSGAEGVTRKGFKLRMVTVFTRHGDRTPMHVLPGIKADNFNCNFSLWYNGSNVKFKQFAHAMSKYTGKQQRNSHFLNWALLPNKDKCGSSDLTSLGALQQLNNGEFLAEKYLGHSSLFNKRLALMSQVHARSTTTSRTYQSAVAFMYGFLPFFNVTQHNIDHSSNKYMCSSSSKMVLTCACPYLNILEQRVKKYKSAVHANSSEYAYIKTAFAKVFNFGDNNSRMPWLSAILDAIVPALCHNISQGCDSRQKSDCIDGDLLQRMWLEYSKSQTYSISDPQESYLKFLSVQSHPVVLEMVHRMRELTEGKTFRLPKYVLYSGHDFTINALLHVLGIHDNAWPPYASRLVFELFEHRKNKHSKFYFKVLYNGVDLTEEVSLCKSTSYTGFCEFKHLADFVFGQMIRRYGYTSYSDACSRRI